MKDRELQDSEGKYRAAARWIGVAVCLAGAAGLAGWWLGIGRLKSLAPGLATMKPNTALSLIFSGISLALAYPEGAWRPRRIAGCLLAAAAALLGLITIVEYLSGWNPGIDLLLFAGEDNTPRGGFPGRMAPVTAFEVWISGAALVLLHARRAARFVEALALGGALLMYVALAGYIYGAPMLYAIVLFTSVAVHTAISFLALCIGLILAAPEIGMAAGLRRPGVSGTAARRLIPAAVLVPLVLGWIRLLGQRKGFYGTEFGLSLMVVCTSVVLLAIAWWTVGSLELVDSERARAEEARMNDFRLLQAVIESTPDAIFVKDLEGRYVLVNAASAAMVGRPIEEIQGKDDTALVPPEVVAAARKIDADVRESRQPVTYEEAVTIDGHERVFLTTKSPLLSKDGKTLGVIGTGRDITERKRHEAEFQQTQKMQALGQLAGGVAHDFNNLLTAILGFSDMLLTTSADGESRLYCEEIVKASERAAGLTGQLLAFSRRQATAPKVVDVNQVVRNMERMLRRLIDENIAVVMRLEEDAGRVRIDPVQLEQILLNLVVNARDAMPKGGRAVISTGRTSLSEPVSGQKGPPAGEYMILSVSDTGSGMDAETRRRIFEPFFTTKERGKGTGLGLSTVFGIVHQNGGELAVTSEPGKGATFTIYLPLTEDQATSAADRKAVDLLRGAETILLVEDDAAVRGLGRQALSMYGYRVLEAAGPSQALAIAAREPFDLVLTDVIMPEMHGPELVELLRCRLGDIRVVYMSGYTEDAFANGTAPGNMRFLPKPFTAQALAVAVREAFAETARGA